MSGLYDPTQTRLRLAYEPPATLCLLGYLPYRNETRLKTRDHFELADFNSGLPLIYDPVILAVFILNFKVFQFGYRKTKYVKTSKDASIAWAKSKF